MDLKELKGVMSAGYHISFKDSKDLIAEVERLEAEKEGLLKHFRLINGTVTCHNLKKIKKLREALEKAREHEQSWLENGAYDGKEDGTVKLLKIIDKALKGDSG